jgi:hypothetical protein
LWTDKNRDNLDHLRYRVARVPAIHLEKLVVEAIRAEAGPIRNRKVNFPIVERSTLVTPRAGALQPN